MSRLVNSLALVAFGFAAGYAFKTTKSRHIEESAPAAESEVEASQKKITPSNLETPHIPTTTSPLIQTTTTSAEIATEPPPPMLPETTTTQADFKEVSGNSYRPWIEPQKAYRDWRNRPTTEIIANSRSILGYSLRPNFVRNFTGTFEGHFTANEKLYALRVELGWTSTHQINTACVGIFSPEKRLVFGSLGTSDLNIFQSKEAKNMLILDLPKTYAVELYLQRPGEFSVLLSFITNKSKGTKTEVTLKELKGQRNPKFDNCNGLGTPLR